MPCANKKGTDQPPSMHFTLGKCFYFVKKFCMGIIERKKKIRVGSKKNRDGRMIVNKHTFFFPIHFGLLHLFHLALLGQEKV